MSYYEIASSSPIFDRRLLAMTVAFRFCRKDWKIVIASLKIVIASEVKQSLLCLYIQ